MQDTAQGVPSILVVEDHIDTLRALELALRRSGFETATARGYAEALAAADRQRFDLVVCDVGLTDGDGCELFQHLRAKYGLDGIAHSAYGMPTDVARSKAAGFAEHLIKPISPYDLIDAIRTVVARRRADARPPHSPATLERRLRE